MREEINKLISIYINKIDFNFKQEIKKYQKLIKNIESMKKNKDFIEI